MATRDYAREELTVHWDSEICIHSGVCARSLPAVFRPSEQPWIRLEGASADEIRATVAACPSGALRFTDAAVTEEVVEPAPTKVTVWAEPDGPLRVDGPVDLVDADGNVVRSGERFFLCRCGHSASKPFCDGSHKRHGFTTE